MIKPLFNNVLLQYEKLNNETSSGIILTTKTEESKYAKVVAVGDGHLADGTVVKMPVKIGDKVYVKGYGKETIKDGEESYFIVSLDNIIAIVE